MHDLALIGGVAGVALAGLVGAGRATTQRDVEICVSSEQKAREQMVKDWTQYAAGDKARCVQAGPKVYLPSYVEWLTCLEMERDVRKMRQGEPPTTNGMTLPKVRPGTTE